MEICIWNDRCRQWVQVFCTKDENGCAGNDKGF